MKKTYKIEVDCANCAAKMEQAVSKIQGIQSARVNFMTQKMTLETDLDSLDALMPEVIKACKKVERDCVIYV